MENYLKNLPVYSFVYPGKKEGGIPEHRNQKEMKDWLNNQPEALSFNEVWDDIEKQLKRNGYYLTHSSKTQFRAIITEESKIKIITKSKEFYLYREQLLDLWQQIRNFGYSNRKIIPNGLGKSISYILPLFSKLEYLKLVKLSDSYTGFSNNPSLGIQFIGKKKQDPIQLELFSNL